MRKYSELALVILETIAGIASDSAAVAEVAITSSSWTPYRELYRRVDEVMRRKEVARGRRLKRNAFKQLIFRLKKSGIIQQRSSAGILVLTNLGEQKLAELRSYCSYPAADLYVPLASATDETIVVVFDIPEKWRSKRNWFREVLTVLHYSKLQQSVWIGRFTIPERLMTDLEKLSLLPYVHFFTVKNFGSISSKTKKM
jgi:DNA-binding transcriptional regulator PaaX